MHFDIIFSVFYTVFLILISIYKGNLLILTLSSPWRSPLPSEHLGSGICDDHLLLHHPGLSAVLRVPREPHRAHVLYDPVPVCHPAQHLVLHLLQLPHHLCASDRDDRGDNRDILWRHRNTPERCRDSQVLKGKRRMSDYNYINSD